MRSLLILALVFGGISSCSGSGPRPIPVQAVVDCTKQVFGADWQPAADQLTADIGNWSKFYSDVGKFGIVKGIDLARCWAMDMLNKYLLVKHATDDATAAKAVGEQIRADALADKVKLSHDQQAPAPTKLCFKMNDGSCI